MFRLLFFCLLLASCNAHVTNWQGSSTPGIDTARYTAFNTQLRHPVQLGKGDLLFLDYAVKADKGAVSFSVQQGSHVVWQKEIDHSDSASLYLTAPAAGKYTVRISGREAAGGYTLHYKAVQPAMVSVKNSTNIELFGLMMQLDNGADIMAGKDTVVIDGRRATWGQWYALAVENYQLYKGYDTCRAMQLYRQLMGEQVYNDFFVDFLLQVDEAPNARINSLTDVRVIRGFSPKGDTAEAKARANEFLAALNDLYRAVDFGAYLEKHKAHYAQANAQVKMNLPGGELLPVMEHYYRQSFNGYYLVPSLNILTSLGFGKVNWNSRTIYNVFGPFGFQSFDPLQPDMAFNYPERIKVLAIHEFGHSFANPAVDRLPDTLIKGTAYLYAPIKEEMTKRAYPSWQMSLYEHFVKVGEYLIAEKLGDTARAEIFLKDAKEAGFIYVPFLVKELRIWDKDPAVNKSFDQAVRVAMQHLQEAYPKR